MPTAREDVKARIDAIEEAYEFFLAYAAQGVSGDRAAKAGGQLRELMQKAVDAMDGLGARVQEAVQAEGSGPLDAWRDAVAVLDADARAAWACARLVLAQPSISSQLVDNLNANIHLRALLTDLFLVDELLG